HTYALPCLRLPSSSYTTLFRACVVGPLLPRNGDIPAAEGRKDTPLDVFYSQPRDVFRRYSIEIEHQNLLPGPRWYSIAWRIIARDRKSTRLNSSHVQISYAVFC